MEAFASETCGALPLDLDCPIPWRQNGSAGTSMPQLHRAGSPVGKSPRPALSGSAVSISPMTGGASSAQSLQPSLLSPVRKAEVPSQDSSPQTWIQRRYYETLWLGEHHSSLDSFLQSVAHMLHGAQSPSKTAAELKKLLRTRHDMRARFSIDTGLASRQRFRKLLALNNEACNFGIDERQDQLRCISSTERPVVQLALSSGPAALVAAEVLRADSASADHLGSLGMLWISAIETRELQLQVLVILAILKLSVEHPQLTSAAEEREEVKLQDQEQKAEVPSNDERGRPHDQVQEGPPVASPPAAVQKRKRKAEKARRWTGGGSIFPWQMSRADGGRKRAANTAASLETANDTESLSKRFESCIDALCLRVATTSTSLDFDDREVRTATVPQSENMLGSPVEHKRLRAARQVIVPPFGSQGRQQNGKEEERDVMQWLCCAVIEPYFSSALPRQCGIVRSRCFVPSTTTTGLTPLRPANKRHKAASARARGSGEKDHHSVKRKEKAQGIRERGLAQAKSTGDVLNAKEHAPDTDKSRLQRSLMDEGSGNLKRLQELQAARRRSTWDAREVSVRRRWDRSQSAGPGTCALGPAFDPGRPRQGNAKPATNAHHNEDPAVARDVRTSMFLAPSRAAEGRALSRTRSEAGGVFGKHTPGAVPAASLSRPPSPPLGLPLRESQILALDTPAKTKTAKSGTLAPAPWMLQGSGNDPFSGHFFSDDDEDEDAHGAPADWLGNASLLGSTRVSSASDPFLMASPTRHRTLARSASMSRV